MPFLMKLCGREDFEVRKRSIENLLSVDKIVENYFLQTSMNYAILIHFLKWEHPENEYKLDKHVSFVNLGTHPVGGLYKNKSQFELIQSKRDPS